MTAADVRGLTATLEYAVRHIPYYRAMARNDCELTLSDFPIIDADIVAERPESFYALERFPDFIITTGGTSGRSSPGYFVLNSSELEAAFLHRLLGPGAEFAAPNFTLDPTEFEGVALYLTDLQHGLVLPPAHGQPIVSLPLEAGRHLALVTRFLAEGIVVQDHVYPVLEIFGSITKLRALTLYCIAAGHDSANFGIRRITTMAFHTSARWKQRLTNYWQTTDVVTTYGLSEFSQAVTRNCDACGGFHLPDTVQAEYVPLDRAGSVDVGPAALVMTALCPFRQAMLLIRYDTGDAIDVLPVCSREATQGFALHGRRRSLLLTEASPPRVVLGAVDVLEALNETEVDYPEVVQYDELAAAVMAQGTVFDRATFREVGAPSMNCAIESDGGRSRLVVTVEIAAGAEGVAKAFTDAMTKRLRDRATSRLGEVLPDTVRVDWTPVGGLEARDLPVTVI